MRETGDVRASRILRALVAFGCGWELVALSTGLVPTICKVSRRHQWLKPLILGALTLDLLIDPPAVVVIIDPA